MVFNILEIALVSFYLGLQVSHTSPLLKKLENQVNISWHNKISSIDENLTIFSYEWD